MVLETQRLFICWYNLLVLKYALQPPGDIICLLSFISCLFCSRQSDEQVGMPLHILSRVQASGFGLQIFLYDEGPSRRENSWIVHTSSVQILCHETTES
jgi:hypothetical protein